MSDRIKRAGGPVSVDRELFNPLGNFLCAFEVAYEEFENELFIYRPYCEEKAVRSWTADNKEIWCDPELPNFQITSGIYDGFTCAWYKHPFRDAYCNDNLNQNDIFSLVLKCVGSLREEILNMRKISR